MKRLFALFVLVCAVAALWGMVGLVRGQQVYTLNFPLEQINYAIWAVNERIGFGAEYAGESDIPCRPGIVVRYASETEWQANNPLPSWQAFTATCPIPGAYQVVWKPGVTPTRSLMLHELGGHAMGCWKHHEIDWTDSLIGSRHVLAPLVSVWAGLTLEDIACIRNGAFWPIYENPATCWVELLPNFDLIAPDALGHYTRMRFVGSVEAQDYRWRLERRVAGPESNCASVRVAGGQIVLDDVRGIAWSGSAIIAPDGNDWRLVAAYPL